MYFETTTTTSLHLPFNNYDITKKNCFWHISNNRNLNNAMLLLIAIVAIFTSTTGLTFGVDTTAFVRPVTNHNQISSELIFSASTKDAEIEPLTGANSEPTEDDRKHYVDIFEQWNLSEDEYEDKTCEENMEQELCPTDASVSCGSINKVEQFCKALLGDSNTRSKAVNRNALEGCKIYVSWNHGSCCHSTQCEYEHGGDDYLEEPEF